MAIKYLSVTDVSKRLGISTAAVSAYKLPQPDATIGRTRGCQRPSTGGTLSVPAEASAADAHAKTRLNNRKSPSHSSAERGACVVKKRV